MLFSWYESVSFIFVENSLFSSSSVKYHEIFFGFFEFLGWWIGGSGEDFSSIGPSSNGKIKGEERGKLKCSFESLFPSWGKTENKLWRFVRFLIEGILLSYLFYMPNIGGRLSCRIIENIFRDFWEASSLLNAFAWDLTVSWDENFQEAAL